MKNSRFFLIAAALFVVAAFVSSCEKDDKTFTVAFNSKGGAPTPPPQTVKQDGRVEKPTEPSRENHNFDGWSNVDSETGAVWNFESDRVTEDMTLFARWSIITHLVNFDSDGGSQIAAQNVPHGSVVIRPVTNPTREGYDFDGWFNGETVWNFATPITTPITLTAKWTKTHVVTFDSGGGSAVAAQIIRNGNTATRPATNPTREGYEFDGWFNGETEWNFGTAITAPVTITAKWIKLHTVTFDSGGGTAVAAQIIRDGNMATRPADPTKSAAGLYIGILTENDVVPFFIGWFVGNVEFDFNLPPTADVTITAKWTTTPTPIENVAANSITAAINFVKAIPRSYTLFIDESMDIAPQILDVANVNLTIIGIGREREIRLDRNGALFTVDRENVSLTLGNNITLVGRSAHGNGGVNNNNPVVLVRWDANFTMLNGSKITGNTRNDTGSGAAVEIVQYASFIMKGGTITGNGVTEVNNTSKAGGVYVDGWIAGSYPTVFSMEGGSVKGNNAISDVLTFQSTDVNLSGNSEIGNLTLHGRHPFQTYRSVAILASNWTGSVSSLNLLGIDANMATVTSSWINQTVLQGTLTPATIGRVTLGNFFSTATTNNTQAIRPFYFISNDGRLVASP